MKIGSRTYGDLVLAGEYAHTLVDAHLVLHVCVLLLLAIVVDEPILDDLDENLLVQRVRQLVHRLVPDDELVDQRGLLSQDRLGLLHRLQQLLQQLDCLSVWLSCLLLLL